MNEPAHSAGMSEMRPTPEGTVRRVFLICNKKGLHARASAKFVQTVEKFDATVTVIKGRERVGARPSLG